MMTAIGTWVLGIAAAALLTSLAQTLMPEGPVKTVGRLTCGMVLLAAVLSPLGQLDATPGERWLAQWRIQMEEDTRSLEQDYEERMKRSIEEAAAAYILDKAAALGLSIKAEVQCRGAQDSFLPDTVRITGAGESGAKASLSRVLTAELGIPPERQFFEQEGSA